MFIYMHFILAHLKKPFALMNIVWKVIWEINWENSCTVIPDTRNE